jgi:mRNA-degrading endonuclease toxin of MazEF toxin-antitoxin module
VKVEQGEIIEVNFYIPNHGFEPHPCVVISNNDVNEYEGFCIVAMLSTTKKNDDYSYHIEKSMLTKEPNKKGQVRCHLVSMVSKNDILGRHGYVEKQYLSEIIDKIKSSVLSFQAVS